MFSGRVLLHLLWEMTGTDDISGHLQPCDLQETTDNPEDQLSWASTQSIAVLWHLYRSKISVSFGKFPKILNNKVSDKMTYTNSADPDQTAPEGAVWSGSTLFAIPQSFLRNSCIKAKFGPK